MASVVAGALSLGVALGPMALPASADTQGSLCQGGFTCGVQVPSELTSLDLGGRLANVAVAGRPGIDVEVRAYLVQFNAAGAITGLLPAGPAVRSRTRTGQTGENATPRLTLTPEQPAADPRGGWLFIGLTDDDGLDLTRRMGRLIPFGGATLRTLGDGYAVEKPVGKTITLDVTGQVGGTGYWVQYEDDQGRWVDVPGQGPSQPTRLSGPPNTRRQLEYVVPAGLKTTKTYRFRVESELNSGRANPSYWPWEVKPSGVTPPEDPDHWDEDFDENLAPDPAPSAGATSKPTTNPTNPTGPDKAGKPSAKPTKTSSKPTSAASTPPAASPTRAPEPDPSSSPSVTPSDAPIGPTTSGSTGPDRTSAAAAVWGREPSATSAGTATLQAPAGLSRSLGALALLLLAAPLAWWYAARRRDLKGAEELL